MRGSYAPAAGEKQLRYMCRYSGCRCKLDEPTSRDRDAFCKRGCFNSYYRNRCRVCEDPLKRKNERQLICTKPKCRKAFRTNRLLYMSRYDSPAAETANRPSDVIDPSKKAHFTGLETAATRPVAVEPTIPPSFRIVAGPALSPRSFSAAVVGDGLKGGWTGGAFERSEAESRTRLKAHFAELTAKSLFQRDTPTVNVVGSCMFAGAPTAVDLGLAAEPTVDRHSARPGEREVVSPDGVRCFVQCPAAAPADETKHSVAYWVELIRSHRAATAAPGGDLSIPPFLRRTP